MKCLPNEEQLKCGFIDFAQLAVELIERSESNTKYLKFAAVNAQVALELFLKYIYTRNGKVTEIQRHKKALPQNDFVEFAQILNHYYSQRRWSYGARREFVSLMETRNSIIHRAQKTEWDIELATSVVRTLFFIHSTWNSEFGESLFERNYGLPNSLAYNKVWRQGVDSFVDRLAGDHDTEVWTCLDCSQYTVVTGEFFRLNGAEGPEYLICLNCFKSINTEGEARLIKCFECHEESFIVDAYNEQDLQFYVGKCSECGVNGRVRLCRNCNEFYHPINGEVFIEGNYCCSNECAECLSDEVV